MGEVYNCYYNRIRNFDPAFSGYYMQLDDSPGEGDNFYSTSPFVEEGRGHWKLTEEISIELENGTVSTDDLLDALNFKIEELDNDTLLSWCDTGMGFDNQQLPVFCHFDVTEISENTANYNQFEVYPNPANRFVCIDGVEAAKVQVYNALGQLVKETKENVIDLSAQEAGTYILKVITPSGVVTKQIIKN